MVVGFLDDRPFPATSDEGERLLKLLLRNYWEVSTVKTIAQSAQLPMAQITWQARASEVWPEVLEVAAQHGLLRRLIEWLVGSPDHANVHRELTRSLLAPSTSGLAGRSPMGLLGPRGGGPAGGGVVGPPGGVAVAAPTVADLDAALDAPMAGPRPLVDRVPLRGHLKELGRAEGSRVLVVSGEDGCGKSHTWYAIAALADRLGTFTPRLVDLSQRAGGPATAAEVMDKMIRLLFGGPRDTEVDPHAQPDTQIEQFVTWLITNPVPAPLPIWLVLDGFVPDCASTDAQSLVTALAIAADRRQLGTLRITVLGFAGRAGRDLLGYALRDTAQHAEEEHWRAFFARYAGLRGESPDDEALALLVAELHPGTELNAVPMRDLADRALELAKALFGADDA